MYSECVRCGYCCMKRPCQFGKNRAENPFQEERCVFLVGDRPGRYACEIMEEIQEAQKSDPFPMFGGGCPSTLFNTYREIAIQERSKDAEVPEGQSPT